MSDSNTSTVHVAAGVIYDAAGRVLIAKRPAHLHQGGLWEFPGGKIDPGESVTQALARELYEELGIRISGSQPLIQIPHDYGDKRVLLDVHTVTAFAGTATGREGQEISWVPSGELAQYTFPAANRGILNAVRLPELYLITGDFADTRDCLEKIERALARGIALIQLRARHFSTNDYCKLARTVLQEFSAQQETILLNTTPEVYAQLDAGGLHLTSERLMQLSVRPVAQDRYLSASVHNPQQLQQAMQVGADFIVISPVQMTRSHPHASPLGWEVFAQLVEKASCPVYALGGLGRNDLPTARACGAQGIAAISALWC